MANRYAVIGQVFIVDGTATVAEAGRIATGGNTTLNITDPGGGGDFTIYMANGTSGTVTSGTSTVTGSPVTLSAGSNTITISGTGTATLNLTIGTAFNYSSVNSWSAASGGQCGASVPTSADNVYPDANSFTAASQVLTVDATSYCLDMDWTGATNNPTFAHNAVMAIYGNYTGIAAMSHTGVFVMACYATSGTVNWFFGTSLSCETGKGTGACILNLLDDCITPQRFYLRQGELVTNGHAITCGDFFPGSYTTARVLTASNSVITCTSYTYTGSNFTVAANTATINCSGNFAGGGVDYNGATVNLTGATSTVSGSNTYAELNLDPAQTQTITFTVGTIQTVGASNLSGSAGHIHTLRSSGTGDIRTWFIAKAGGGTIEADYIDLSHSTGSPASTWYYGPNSTNSGNNSGWLFQYLITLVAEMSLSASILKSWGRTLTISTGLTLAANILKSWGRTIATSASMTLAATVTKALDFTRATSSGLTLSPTFSKALDYTRTVTSGLSLAASILKSWGRTIVTSAGITLAATITRAAAFIKTLSTGLTAAVTIAKQTAYTRTTSTGITLAFYVRLIGRMIKVIAITSNYRTVKTINSMYRTVKTIQSLYRHVKSIVVGG